MYRIVFSNDAKKDLKDPDAEVSKITLDKKWDKLRKYIDAMGRNNYLFCQNEQSAERTCKIYSIIESCKLCKIDPYRYICEILSRKPEVGESWDNLLPSNIKFA